MTLYKYYFPYEKRVIKGVFIGIEGQFVYFLLDTGANQTIGFMLLMRK